MSDSTCSKCGELFSENFVFHCNKCGDLLCEECSSYHICIDACDECGECGSNLTFEEVKEIMQEPLDCLNEDSGYNIEEGKKIVGKSIPDVILFFIPAKVVSFGNVNNLLNAGLSKNDFYRLRSLGWFIDYYNNLSCYW